MPTGKSGATDQQPQSTDSGAASNAAVMDEVSRREKHLDEIKKAIKAKNIEELQRLISSASAHGFNEDELNEDELNELFRLLEVNNRTERLGLLEQLREELLLTDSSPTDSGGAASEDANKEEDEMDPGSSTDEEGSMGAASNAAMNNADRERHWNAIRDAIRSGNMEELVRSVNSAPEFGEDKMMKWIDSAGGNEGIVDYLRQKRHDFVEQYGHLNDCFGSDSESGDGGEIDSTDGCHVDGNGSDAPLIDLGEDTGDEASIEALPEDPIDTTPQIEGGAVAAHGAGDAEVRRLFSFLQMPIPPNLVYISNYTREGGEYVLHIQGREDIVDIAYQSIEECTLDIIQGKLDNLIWAGGDLTDEDSTGTSSGDAVAAHGAGDARESHDALPHFLEFPPPPSPPILTPPPSNHSDEGDNREESDLEDGGQDLGAEGLDLGAVALLL